METYREKMNRFSREYYQKNREKILLQIKLRRAANPDHTREMVKKNNDKRKQQIRQYATEQRQRLRDFVLNIKQNSACPCGEKHPICLTFHHRDRNQKIISINVAIKRAWSIEKLQKEITKCDLLCFNCHAKLHWKERQDSKITLIE